MPADMFAKIDGIKGESLDDKHKDEIEVHSFSWGATNGGSMSQGSGGGDGKSTIHEVNFTHDVDKASAALWLACATGWHIKEATITARKAGKGQFDFLTVKLSDVLVTGVVHANSGGSLTESVSLSFAKVAYELKPQKADGSLDAGVHFKYNVKTRKEE
jgi:type VI secretion system secreted protein Hcp